MKHSLLSNKFGKRHPQRIHSYPLLREHHSVVGEGAAADLFKL